MEYLSLVMTVGAALIGIGQAQLKDPPRSFTRTISFNCLAYSHPFRCRGDGVCIPPERVRDGTKDCLDGSDEATLGINLCDYAPYFPDYRCSVYADCIDLPDGYACRCKRGYVGAGESCQPAPFNLPQFAPSPRPFLIQTRKKEAYDTAGRTAIPTLFDLSQEVLETSDRRSPKSVVGDADLIQGNLAVDSENAAASADAMRRIPLDRRELHNDSSTTASRTTIDNEGLHINGLGDYVCPSGTVMVNVTGRAWCLRLNGGRIDRSSDLNNTDYRLPPSLRTAEPVVRNRTTDLPTGLASKIAAILAENLATPTTQASVVGKTGAPMVTVQGPLLPADYLLNESTVQNFSNKAITGPTGYAPGGGFFGYMPTSASRKLGNLWTIVPGNRQLVRGTVISPIKVWNETGGAITAYRIQENGSLPASCLAGSTAYTLYLCADQKDCVTPDRILDGWNDCLDGSDEIPEFIDECAFGMQWPQYKCGMNAMCTDAERGYTCHCFEKYIWDGNTCSRTVSDNNSSNTLGTDGSNTADNVDHSAPTSVSLLSYPGYATWISNTGSNGRFASVVQQQQRVPAAFRRPTTLCTATECLSPELVTLGPIGIAGFNGDPNVQSGQPSDLRLPEVNPQNPIRVLQTGNPGGVTTFVPANYVMGGGAYPQGQPGDATETPGVTITGAYYPSLPTTPPAPFMAAGSAYDGHFPQPPTVNPFASSYSVTETTVVPPSSNSDSQWLDVLEALRKQTSNPQTSSTTTTPATPISTATSISTATPISTNIMANMGATAPDYSLPVGAGAYGTEFSGTVASIRPYVGNGHAATGRPVGNSAVGSLTLTNNANSNNNGYENGNGNGAVSQGVIPVQTSQPFQFGQLNQGGGPLPGGFTEIGSTNNTENNNTSQSIAELPVILSSGSNAAAAAIGSNQQQMTSFGQAVQAGTGGAINNIQLNVASPASGGNSEIGDTAGQNNISSAGRSDVNASYAGNLNLTQAQPFPAVRPPFPTVRPPFPTVRPPFETGLLTVRPPFETGFQTVRPPFETGLLTVRPPFEIGLLTVRPPFETGLLTILQNPENPIRNGGDTATGVQTTTDSTFPISQTNSVRPSDVINPLFPFGIPNRIRPTPSTVSTTSPSDLTYPPANYPNSAGPGTRPDQLVDLQAAGAVLTGNANVEGASTVGLIPTAAPATAILVPFDSTRLRTTTSDYDRPYNSVAPGTPAGSGVTNQSLLSGLSANADRDNGSLPEVVATATDPYPTSIFWDVPAGPQKMDSQVLAPILMPVNATAEGNASLSAPGNGTNGTRADNRISPLESVYDCFGDLFRTAYSALQRTSRTCADGCGKANEICAKGPGRCDCATGFARTGQNGDCLPALQYNVGVTMNQLCGKPLDFQQSFSDLSDPSTQRFAVVVCYQIEQLIRQSTFASRYSPSSCHPNGFTPGSVISNVGLSFASNATSTTGSAVVYELAAALQAVLAANQGALTNDSGLGLLAKPDPVNSQGQPAVPLYSVAITDVRECSLGIANCGANADCEELIGSYRCRCRVGFFDNNPTSPGRNCFFLTAQNASLINGTKIDECPKEYYTSMPLIKPCLHPAYFILLIIAFIIAGLLVLSLISGILACCCGCCSRNRRVVLEVPQVALLRAAARSPRPSGDPEQASGGANVNYQILKSVDKSSLDPSSGPRAPSAPAPGPYTPLIEQLDLEKGENDEAAGTSNEKRRKSDDVQTWEEVEVPMYVSKEGDDISKRALSPSLGSAQVEKTSTVINSEILEETVTKTELEIPHIYADGVSIGSSSDIQRIDFTLPPSPSQSLKALTSAMHIAKKFHLEAQTHLRKASAETRNWEALARTESLKREDGLDVDTLPHNDYDKEPVYELSSPIPGSAEALALEEKTVTLQRLGVGTRDSFDDVMDQTNRFYQQSSSDVEYEKEGDLSDTGVSGTQSGTKSGEDGGAQHQPAFPMGGRSETITTEDSPAPGGLRKGLSQDDDDHQSLKSTDEDELVNLRGSVTSIKSLKLEREASLDEVIDQMVDDQPVFDDNDSDEEEYLRRKLSTQIISNANTDLTVVTVETERKTSTMQRDIAINEFDALGERDSIDDFLDHTDRFFSRASTQDSFQLSQSQSVDEAGSLSRKTSQNMLTVDPNGPEPSPTRQRHPLLKKRSAFHSQNSMNKIMERPDSSEIGSSSADQENPDAPQKTEVQERDETEKLALDDDDINEFFNAANNPGSVSVTEAALIALASRRNSETGQRDSPERKRSGEFLNESVVRNAVDDSEFEADEAAAQRQVEFEAKMCEDAERAAGIGEETFETSAASRRGSTVGKTTVEILEESVTSFDPDKERRESTKSNSSAKNRASPIERLEDQRPPSRMDSPDMGAQTIRVTPPADDPDMSPRGSEDSPTNRLIKQNLVGRGVTADGKSIKSVSDQNLQVGEMDAAGQPVIPHDSDSGVYVETLHPGSSAGRQANNILSSQDDLRIFEGQEARREGSGSSYQRLSQSDDEEEIMKRYSTAFEKKTKLKTRTRNNYAMGAPESRHVYYSSRPKQMPPNREESEIWKDTTWWRRQLSFHPQCGITTTALKEHVKEVWETRPAVVWIMTCYHMKRRNFIFSSSAWHESPPYLGGLEDYERNLGGLEDYERTRVQFRKTFRFATQEACFVDTNRAREKLFDVTRELLVPGFGAQKNGVVGV
ncbi:hypothetical protein BV898_10972 [Hypsibius exemplaris]|uniref:EGF-like domain-containing protein n=1 Tax=Hypsibius exemplaris TaxID=2072580 RepID=A0A1W0WI19_HYPEX|nr:hypothetical protein BV898_10972 [Hypsibius exemplaris]